MTRRGQRLRAAIADAIAEEVQVFELGQAMTTSPTPGNSNGFGGEGWIATADAQCGVPKPATILNAPAIEM